MQWRARTLAEAHSAPSTASITTGETELWLTSDVVNIGGLGSSSAGTYYGLQMTFDNRINIAFDGQAAGEAQYNSNHIVSLNSGGQWATVATGSYEGNVSLQAFLGAHGSDISALIGDWGMYGSTPDGQGKAWAIVRGGGVFAVVPEPATIIMMVSATLGAVAYGWRRWSRKSRLPA